MGDGKFHIIPRQIKTTYIGQSIASNKVRNKQDHTHTHSGQGFPIKSNQ